MPSAMESQEQYLEGNRAIEETPGDLDNDVAMDLFLNQMDGYNPQQLNRQDIHGSNAGE